MSRLSFLIAAFAFVLAASTVVSSSNEVLTESDDHRVSVKQSDNATNFHSPLRSNIDRDLQTRVCRIPRFVGEWEETPAYPITSSEPHGLLVGDDFVIFGGFYDVFTKTRKQTYARNMIQANSQWRRMEDIPHFDGITHTPVVKVGSSVYLCGGYVGGTPGPNVPDCYVYDHSKPPGTDQWSKIRALPLNGTGGAGIIYDTPRNRLFYVGGAQRPRPGVLFAVDTPKVWKYDFDDISIGWRPSSEIPYLGNHISYTTAKDELNRERHFFLGGQVGEDERLGNLADVYEFRPGREIWEKRTSMPYGRGHATASTRPFGCGFIVAGGAINAGQPTGPKRQTAEILYYHIPSNNWTRIGLLPTAMVTPLVEIDRNGFMHFVDTRRRALRRRIVM